MAKLIIALFSILIYCVIAKDSLADNLLLIPQATQVHNSYEYLVLVPQDDGRLPRIEYSCDDTIYVAKLNDTFNAGQGNWNYGTMYQMNKTGGSGDRTAVSSVINNHCKANVGVYFSAGHNSMCFFGEPGGTELVTDLEGTCIGYDALATALPTASSTVSITASRLETFAGFPGLRKTGLQIVDLSKENIVLGNFSTGIMINATPGSLGFQNAIHIANDGMGPFPLSGLRSTIVKANGGAINNGIDFSNLAFTDSAIKLPLQANSTNSGRIVWNNPLHAQKWLWSDGTNTEFGVLSLPSGIETSLGLKNGIVIAKKKLPSGEELCRQMDFEDGIWKNCTQ